MLGGNLGSLLYGDVSVMSNFNAIKETCMIVFLELLFPSLINRQCRKIVKISAFCTLDHRVENGKLKHQNVIFVNDVDATKSAGKWSFCSVTSCHANKP